MILNLSYIVFSLLLTQSINAYRFGGLEQLRCRSFKKNILYSSNTIDTELTGYDNTKLLDGSTFIQEPVMPQDFSKGELTIFVLDMSMPGVDQRIRSIKSAVTSIQPRGKVAVIGCLRSEAYVYLEPTSSILTATRSLKNLKKSVMGKISRGMQLSLDIAEKSLKAGECSHVSIAILADGRAHGLRAGPTSCDDFIPICDLELLEEAEMLAKKRDMLIESGYKLHATVVDTEILGDSLEWSPEGARLAASSHASYYHAPHLDGRKLLRILNDVKFNNEN